MTATPDPAARKAVIDRLRPLARFLASHPSAPVPKWGTSITLTTHGTDEEDRRAVDEFATVMGAEIRDDWDTTGHYCAARTFGVISYEISGISAATMTNYHAEQNFLAELRSIGAASRGKADDIDEAA